MLLAHGVTFTRFASNYGTGNVPQRVGTDATGGNSVYGASVTLLSAIDFEACLMYLRWYEGTVSTANTATLFDVLIDPAGGTTWASTPLVADILAGFGVAASTAMVARNLLLPIRIPSGASLGIRARSLTTGRPIKVVVDVFGLDNPSNAFRSGSKVITLGPDAAVFQGTSVSPSATANTFGSWTNIGSPLESDVFSINQVNGGVHNSASWTSGQYVTEVGYSSTTLAGPALWTDCTGGEAVYTNPGLPISAVVPAGTQMQVRAKSRLASAPAISMAIYAVAY